MSGEVTRLLNEIGSGNQDARNNLLEVAYDELRRLAGDLMRNERNDHTLQPTALVHEAAMRIFGSSDAAEIPNRPYFFASMARAMRRILIEHARQKNAKKRGGDQDRVGLDAVVAAVEKEHDLNLLELDTALVELSKVDQRASEVVTLRFFGGMEMQDISEHLEISLSTVERDWRFARAWLRQTMKG